MICWASASCRGGCGCEAPRRGARCWQSRASCRRRGAPSRRPPASS
jgi:hypothetical protein